MHSTNGYAKTKMYSRHCRCKLKRYGLSNKLMKKVPKIFSKLFSKLFSLGSNMVMRDSDLIRNDDKG